MMSSSSCYWQHNSSTRPLSAPKKKAPRNRYRGPMRLHATALLVVPTWSIWGPGNSRVGWSHGQAEWGWDWWNSLVYFFHKINNDLTVELKPLCFQHVSTVPPFLSAIFLHITFLKIPEGTMTSFQEQICFGSEHLLQTQQHLVARQQLCHHGIFQGLKTRNLLGNVPPVFLSQYHGLAKNYGTKHEINKHKHPVFNSFWVCKNLGSFANSFLHIICNSGAGHGIAVLQREHHTVHEILGRTGSCRQQPFFSGMVHWELPGTLCVHHHFHH